MSSSRHDYFGAFLKCYHQNIIEQENLNSCLNNNCKNYFKKSINEFCPNCGQQIVEQTVDVEKLIDYYQWAEDNDFTDVLSGSEYARGDNFMYLFPNHDKVIQQVGIKLPDEDDLELEITQIIDPNTYIEKFKEIYSDLLLKLIDDGFGYEIMFGYVVRIV
jgi:hypothetical protein